MQEHDDLIADYLACCDEVRLAFDGLSDESAQAHPMEGKWSAFEVLCHLVDADLNTAARIRTAIVADKPRLPSFTRDELSTVLTPAARNLKEELILFQTLRTQTAGILRASPASTLDRTVILVKPGGEVITRTVRQFVSGISQHVRHHLSFVYEKRHALGLADTASISH